jgi:LPS export ABC transporter protein LptC
MIWQRKASIAVAAVGVGLAGAVYFSIGTRQARAVLPAPARLDPKAILESSGAVVQQVRGTKEDYQIKAMRQLAYEGGSSKSLDVEITIRDTGGRDFVITAKEARSGEKNSAIDISGAVTLKASDGFVLTTEHATFNDSDGIVRAEGALAFNRGGMSGTGIGMTYDKNLDILVILDQARVTFVDETGAQTMEFSGGGATLTRPEHVLFVERGAHVVRGDQTLEAVTAKARLTETDEQITHLELRGESRVAGGSKAFDAMSANDIDLDYSEDGTVLERVFLSGQGAIALTGDNGAQGRQFFGDTLNLRMDPGGVVTSVVGSGNVRLDLPATKTAARRSIRSRAIDATGGNGKGLETAKFADDVTYQEDPAKAGGQPRIVKARALTAAMADDAITNAIFTGSVTFTEQNMEARAARAEYNPQAGTLRLIGAEQGRAPHVADQEVAIDADTIDVTLESHHMTAKGAAKTVLQPQRAGSNSKLPSLLDGKQSANAHANALEYDGKTGFASYVGDAQIWQGDTAIRGDRITIDRASGDLIASAKPGMTAYSTMTMTDGVTVGRAPEIRYTDAKREIQYAPAPASTVRTQTAETGPAAPRVAATPLAPASGPVVQLSGPAGNLVGGRIVVMLQKEKIEFDRLEAYDRIAMKVDTRNATGDRLTYYAADGRYVMSGIGGTPVKVVEVTTGKTSLGVATCRETTGKTLTFFKSTDRIIVDGRDEIRTQTKSGGVACPQPRTLTRP